MINKVMPAKSDKIPRSKCCGGRVRIEEAPFINRADSFRYFYICVLCGLETTDRGEPISEIYKKKRKK